MPNKFPKVKVTKYFHSILNAPHILLGLAVSYYYLYKEYLQYNSCFIYTLHNFDDVLILNIFFFFFFCQMEWIFLYFSGKNECCLLLLFELDLPKMISVETTRNKSNGNDDGAGKFMELRISYELDVNLCFSTMVPEEKLT